MTPQDTSAPPGAKAKLGARKRLTSTSTTPGAAGRENSRGEARGPKTSALKRRTKELSEAGHHIYVFALDDTIDRRRLLKKFSDHFHVTSPGDEFESCSSFGRSEGKLVLQR